MSPLSVLNTDVGLRRRSTFDTIVAVSVSPSGRYSSPTIVHAVGLGVGLDDLVGRAGEDVVAADEVHLGHALLLQVVERRDDLLVGRGARVEDVRRRLEALVLHRVEEQAVEALEHRQHRLAAGRGPPAEHDGDLVDGEELLGLLGEGRPVGGAVLDDGLDLLAEHAAVGVDLLDGQQLGVVDRHLADRHRAAQRVEDADLDRLFTRVGRIRRLGVVVASTCGRDERHDHCEREETPRACPLLHPDPTPLLSRVGPF